MENEGKGDTVSSISTISSQPDADAIKLFIGQVPTSMDEKELRGMFTEFGQIHQFSIIRDRVTHESKGNFPLFLFNHNQAHAHIDC